MTAISDRNTQINAVLRELLSDTPEDHDAVRAIYDEYGGGLQWWRCYNVAKARRTVKTDWIEPEEFKL